jgi:hypothetical protein
MIMLPHQQRVVDEKLELDEKLGKLSCFADSEMFAILSANEQTRLLRQYSYMTMYSKVLGERIAAFA